MLCPGTAAQGLDFVRADHGLPLRGRGDRQRCDVMLSPSVFAIVGAERALPRNVAQGLDFGRADHGLPDQSMNLLLREKNVLPILPC